MWRDRTLSEQSDKSGQVLVLLGGGGDLALRMLLPSLYNLDADRLLPADMRIVGVARHPLDGDGGYLKLAREALDKRTKVDEQVWARFSSRLSYLAADMTTAEGGEALAKAVGDHSALAIFFAVSPSLFAPICAALGAANLTGPKTRLVLEKPIGRDLESSRAIKVILSRRPRVGSASCSTPRMAPSGKQKVMRRSPEFMVKVSAPSMPMSGASARRC